ncbi:MAG: hypothetical protein ACRDYA_19775, partial [Egibacteraceae bacterium]
MPSGGGRAGVPAGRRARRGPHDGWDRRGHPDRSGTAFAVWAPNAQAVRVIGDFNSWDGRLHPMRSLGGSGIWELFVPGVGHGAYYKYEIAGAD